MHVGLVETTYLSGYRGEAPLMPRLTFKTLPCLYPPGSTQPCREMTCLKGGQRHVPMKKPKQRPPDVAIDAVPQPTISKTVTFGDASKVYETKFGPMDMLTVNYLHRKMQYSTATQRAGEECATPMIRPTAHFTEREQKPDMVGLQSKRYEDIPEHWQAAPLWDRLQTRHGMARPGNTELQDQCCKREELRGPNEGKVDKPRLLLNRDITTRGLPRPLPGYGGYTPMTPPDSRRDKLQPHAVISSTHTTYRAFSEKYHPSKQHARRETFSNMITLTTPFNPNNLIGYDVTPANNSSKYTALLRKSKPTIISTF